MHNISYATEKNWRRLNVDIEKKELNHRANKSKSIKTIIPVELFKNKKNIPKALKITECIKEKYNEKEDIEKIMISLALKLMIQNKLIDKELKTHKRNVLNFIKEYKIYYKELLEIDLPLEENDILGIIYQMLQTEGEKNQKGSYYTPLQIIKNMLKNIKIDDKITILDPCCGTGRFLLEANIKNPHNLYGIDLDKIAVIISKVNLIIKYKNIDFEPNIIEADFFEKINEKIKDIKFDYIITNPPWGANISDKYNRNFKVIKSGETYSYSIVQSQKLLKENGTIRFLLPQSFLNVKLHADIRKFLIEKMYLKNIYLYTSNFSGVVTKFISINAKNSLKNNYNIEITDFDNKYEISSKEVKKDKDYRISCVDKNDIVLIQKVYNKKFKTLEGSTWGLGIVTGDNKKKLVSKRIKGYEAIYTGKEIIPYKILSNKKFIHFDKENLQQVAPENIYRAKEKLVYKFISKKLTFAYDNSGSLFLNSANILIPNIEGMSIKTVMAFLNSNLFAYIYHKKFGDIKILRGNLEQLPMPIISKEQNKEVEKMVDEVLQGNTEYINEINKVIYKIYDFKDIEIKYIEEAINGKIEGSIR